jgi:oligopeptide/dipeptide ABC transporter ATP-binding protein
VMYAGEVVEQAAAGPLYAAPAHPYTEGLLRAMPRLGQARDRLATIPGAVPSSAAWPAGCRFRERCPYAWARCETEHPPLYQLGDGRSVRCHLAAEPARRVAHPAAAGSASP